MKKYLLLFAFCLSIFASANAQSLTPWATQASNFSSPGMSVFGISAPTANDVWAIAFDTSFMNLSTEFVRSTDGGQTFNGGNIDNSLMFHQVAGLSALNSTIAWVTVFDFFGSQGKIYKTTNGGNTWNLLTNNVFLAPDGNPTGIHFFDANNGIVMGDPNGGYFEFHTTTDGGNTWNRVPQTSIPAAITNEFSLALQAVVGNNLWFATSEGRIFHSNDKGNTWTVSSTGIPNNKILSLAFSDSQNGLLLSDNGLLRTMDGGQTWSPVTPMGQLHYMDLASVPGAAGTYVSVGFDAGDEGSSITTDHGQTWASLENSISHSRVVFAGPSAGWSGGINSAAGNDGIHRFTGTVASAPKTLNPKLVSVYPNPGTGEFNLKLENLMAKKVSYTITNAIGSKVVAVNGLENSQHETIHIDLTKQPKGLYFLTLKADDRVHTQKLIVK